MTARTDLCRRLLDAIGGVPDLRPAPPAMNLAAAWLPFDIDELAVDVGDDGIEVRVIAAALPLPPVLDAAETALRAVLDGAGLGTARLRIVVTELDPAALDPGRARAS